MIYAATPQSSTAHTACSCMLPPTQQVFQTTCILYTLVTNLCMYLPCTRIAVRHFQLTQQVFHTTLYMYYSTKQNYNTTPLLHTRTCTNTSLYQICSAHVCTMVTCYTATPSQQAFLAHSLVTHEAHTQYPSQTSRSA